MHMLSARIAILGKNARSARFGVNIQMLVLARNYGRASQASPAW